MRLRRSAIVIGDITCQSLSMDPDVSVGGKLNVHREAPQKLHLEGEEAPEDEVADSNETTYISDSNNSTHNEKHRIKSNASSSKNEGGSKKESGGADRDHREKEEKDKNRDKNKDKDESRKKSKDGGSGSSSKSKTTS